MNRILPIVFACVFLGAAIVFGGSSTAGLYGGAAIQFAAAIGIALAIGSRHDYLGGTQRVLLALLVGALGLAIVHLIPLPPSLWGVLPGHHMVGDGLGLTGVPVGWRPISLAPAETLGSALLILPVVAAALIGMRARRAGLIALFTVLIVLTLVSIGVGLAQRVGGLESPFYFYEITNRGEAVGLFANSNHLATLCVIAIPAATALFVAQRGSTKPNASWIVLIAIVLIALGGVVLANSLAGVGLTLPALISIFLIARLRRGGGTARTGASLAIGGVAAAVAISGLWVVWGHVSSDKFALGSEMGRAQLWTRTLHGIATFLPLGSGLGSFPLVYPQFENAQRVTQVFANHAHNDVLEVLMTGGVPALLLMVGFGAWWLHATVKIWRNGMRNSFAEASTIVTGLIMLHETVDYPIRTAAVAVVFGLCCGIMARPQRIVEPAEKPERVVRHMVA
uniref:O-antigen ligase family protein n=1 Tax=Sphingomonas sp. TaxID=28214 RepID=UPI0025FB6A60|nr:O-antigen ligase family protein [Sphingomonas sp.]